MKALKLYGSILLLATFSIITGCSDSIVSHSTSANGLFKNSASENNFEDGVYNSKFKLEPGQTIFFDYSNTNLILIYSYSVANCSMRYKDLRIRSSNQADSSSLPCNWKKAGSFAFEDLAIENISSQVKTISVSLHGYTLNN